MTLRYGGAADEAALGRLAALDSAVTPAQPVLLAEVEGRLVAALSLADEAVVADPFTPTADLVDLLRARARQLDGAERPRRHGRGHGRAWSWSRLPALGRR